MSDIAIEDVYYYFRKAQAESKNRGFKMPKDFVSHINNRFSKKNREALVLATKMFNTKWSNIDVYKYMQCGFELFKTFSYIMFFDKRVLNLYKVKDKNHKREMNINKKQIIETAKFVKKYMAARGVTLPEYCNLTNDNQKIIIKHYIHNKVDKFFIVWLIKSGILILNDEDRAYIPYIVVQYREILEKVQEMWNFLTKVKENM